MSAGFIQYPVLVPQEKEYYVDARKMEIHKYFDATLLLDLFRAPRDNKTLRANNSRNGIKFFIFRTAWPVAHRNFARRPRLASNA